MTERRTRRTAARARTIRGKRAALLVSLVLLVPPPSGAAQMYPGVRVPAGYVLEGKRAVGSGVAQYLIMKRRGVEQVVRIARLAHDSPHMLRVGIANGRVPRGTRGFQKTSSICRRHDCLLGVNGDFFYGDGSTAGAIVSNGEPGTYPPKHDRPHLIVARDGRLELGRIALATRLIARYPRFTADLPAPLDRTTAQDALKEQDEIRSIPITRINRARKARNGAVLYTPRFGTRTRTSDRGDELIIRVIQPKRIRVGAPAVVRLVKLRRGDGNNKIPRDGAVISAKGSGARQLRRLWDDVRARAARRDLVLRIDSSRPAWEVVAGNPVVLREGKVVYPGRSSFARARHPRTLVGRTEAGDALLVTVDGRRPGRASGMTLTEAAALMKRLGAVDAMNLDGGGSTTFVVRGRVKNKPSDRIVLRGNRIRKVSASRRGDRVLGHVERRVPVALLVVPR